MFITSINIHSIHFNCSVEDMKRRNYIIFLLCFTIFPAGNITAQSYLDRDSLVADFEHLISLLEASHPDPYTSFDGRVFFHKKAFDLKNRVLNTDSCSIADFCNLVSAFLANLEDGHTGIWYPPANSQSSAEKLLKLQTKVIPGGIVFKALPIRYKSLLGSRIESVNGLPVDSLLQLTAQTVACENLYGRYAALSRGINQENFLSRILHNAGNAEVTFGIITPDGVSQELRMPFIDRKEFDETEWAKVTRWSLVNEDNSISYRFLDSKNKIALFKVKSIMARENFRVTLENKWSGAYEGLRNHYKWTLKKDMPADTLQALAETPAISEIFHEMLVEMKKNKSDVLIIDLRGNGGGWTPITLPLIYELYGDRYLQTDMNDEYYKRVSTLLLKKQNMTLDQFNKGWVRNFKLGDYTFFTPAADEEDKGKDIEKLRNNFLSGCMSEVKSELEKQNGIAFYTPGRVYVITDDRTFSAAFHFSYYLWKMGATVVGVPCRQAPNTFMEQTPFELPYTKLNGSISNSVQYFFPTSDRRAKVFWPEVMLSYDDYKKYGFDEHAELLYLVDLIKNKSR